MSDSATKVLGQRDKVTPLFLSLLARSINLHSLLLLLMHASNDLSMLVSFNSSFHLCFYLSRRLGKDKAIPRVIVSYTDYRSIVIK